MSKQKMNTETLVKKLKAVSNTQDSIPMFSLWIIHHKAHHKLIADQWLNVLKHSKSPHRLTLLYLCNDVIQNCHRKNADIFKEAFCDVLPEAITLLRDSLIKSSAERVVQIWAKRKILEPEITDQLLAGLHTTKPQQKLRNKLLVEYKTSVLINEIKKYKEAEDEIEADQQRLKTLRVDVSSCDAIRKLKDKIGGEKFSKDFEESASQVEVFLGRYEKFVERRKQLLELLDKGSVYYHAQYHEAKIVVNAYKNFEGRVGKMKRGLDKVKERLPAPQRVDDAFNPNAMFKVAAALDSQEDMEMSDDDKELGSKPSKIVAVDFVKPASRNPPETVMPALPQPVENATENVIKMIASGLGAAKAVPKTAEESLKRVMTGLISRPGMRGASTAKIEPSVHKAETNLGSLTITRSVQVVDNAKESNPNILTPLGSESPPSPTGSPELNISSPPRQQSLDSRLADLFNNPASAGTDKAPATSDSESDVGELINNVKKELEPQEAAPPPQPPTVAEAEEKVEENLPGLGFSNEVSIPGLSDLFSPKNSQFATPDRSLHPNTNTPTPNHPSSTERRNSHAIPVIGGFFRSTSQTDGSSTPTLDEAPFSVTQTSASMEIPFPPPPSFLSPPRFSGDALSFLSKFMGQATKTELDESEPATNAPTPRQEAPPSQTWPTQEAKSIESQPNSNWSTRSNAMPTTKFSEDSASTVQYNVSSWESSYTSAPTYQKHSETQINFPHHPASVAKHSSISGDPIESPMKKPRWSTEEQQRPNIYRSESHEPPDVGNQRKSNLITLSGMPRDGTGNKALPRPEEPTPPSYEPMAHFANVLRKKSTELEVHGTRNPPHKEDKIPPPVPVSIHPAVVSEPQQHEKHPLDYQRIQEQHIVHHQDHKQHQPPHSHLQPLQHQQTSPNLDASSHNEKRDAFNYDNIYRLETHHSSNAPLDIPRPRAPEPQRHPEEDFFERGFPPRDLPRPRGPSEGFRPRNPWPENNGFATRHRFPGAPPRKFAPHPRFPGNRGPPPPTPPHVRRASFREEDFPEMNFEERRPEPMLPGNQERHPSPWRPRGPRARPRLIRPSGGSHPRFAGGMRPHRMRFR